MSLTGPNDHLYAAVHEAGANDFMTAIYMQRGHYFHYGSSLFVPASSSSVTQQAPLGNIVHWKLDFSLPRIDFHTAFVPQFTPPLTAGPDHLVVSTEVTLTLSIFGVQQSFAGSVWAVAIPVLHPGSKTMTLSVTDTHVGPVPANLQKSVDAVATLLLNGALAGVPLPYFSIPLGAFTLVTSGAPRIDQDELSLKGNL